MNTPPDEAGKHHGLGNPGSVRYGVLCLRLVAWIALGVVLWHAAAWPSTCTPQGLIETYGCAARLPESGRWQDAALLTWLWASPILILLEAVRRLSARGE